METVNVVTEALFNILLGILSIAIISWECVALQTFFNNRKCEKRDEEYHAKRMEELERSIKL